MKNERFTKNLIKVAFCAMTCDLEIDKSEIFKIKEIVDNDFYFKGFSLTNEIDSLEKEFKSLKLLLIERTLNEQTTLDYTESQKIIVLDTAIGIIRADRVIHQEEKDFINQLIINLRVPSVIVDAKFGDWDSLKEEKIPTPVMS